MHYNDSNSKSRSKPPGLQLLLLGLVNGLVYACFALLLFRWSASKLQLSKRQEASRLGLDPIDTMNLISEPAVIIHLAIIFAFTSFVVYRYWIRVRSSLVLLWTTIGLTSVALWNGYALVTTWLESPELRGDYGRGILRYVLGDLYDPLFGVSSFLLVLVVSVAYSICIKLVVRWARSRQS